MEYGTIEREIEIEASPGDGVRGHHQPGAPDGVVARRGGASSRRPARSASSCSATGRRPRRTSPRSPSSTPSRRGCSRSAGSTPTASGRTRATRCSSPSSCSTRGDGTLLRMTETGFREKGWEVAVLEEQYRDHVSGWDHFLPPPRRLRPTVGRVPVVTRRRRRRPLVRRRRPDPAADARPPAGRRHRHGHLAERAAARHPPGRGQAPGGARPGRSRPRRRRRPGAPLPGRRRPARPGRRPAGRGRLQLGRPAASHRPHRRASSNGGSSRRQPPHHNRSDTRRSTP